MVVASQLNAGMTIMMAKKPYRVESAVKVATQKTNPFIKVKLRNLLTHESIEKNFRPVQELAEVSLEEHRLEYLYPEGNDHVFLDMGTLDIMKVSRDVIGGKVHYLKEGIEVKASCFVSTIFAVDLPQFLELMVSSIEMGDEGGKGGSTRMAILETGARVEVPPFIDVGDVIKVDTRIEEYIQRV